MTHTPTYWALVPAAGIGSRFQSDTPKQYALLGEKTVLEYSIERLLAVPAIAKVIVLLHPKDTEWQQLPLATHPRVEAVEGGAERHLSVLQGLEAIATRAQADDWVLVHDAVRPCVTVEEISALLTATADHLVGGLLGTPVSDTLKQVTTANAVSATVSREGIWAAQTPQVFRFGLLQAAIQAQVDSGELITDEAMAIERQGYQPLMVAGRRENIKVTLPHDLGLAALYLQQQAFHNA